MKLRKHNPSAEGSETRGFLELSKQLVHKLQLHLEALPQIVESDFGRHSTSALVTTCTYIKIQTLSSHVYTYNDRRSQMQI